jgi:3-phenylpropionate/cinnamic acid dioxygenase small subunit
LLPFADHRYGEVVQLLYEEASLLDHGEYEAWLDLLAEDVTYRLPLRLNLRQRSNDASRLTYIFNDDLASLRVRVARLGTNYAWAETPPSRTRHLVSNVRVWSTDQPDEVDAASAFLVYRSRGSQPDADLFSGERQDRLRRSQDGWRLVSRLITLDQAVVGARTISIFL